MEIYLTAVEGYALIFVIESDFLDGNNLIGHFVSGFIDNSIGALSYFVDALVAFDFGAS